VLRGVNKLLMIRIGFYLVCLCCFASCVTNEKIQYLQKDDVNIKDLPKDSVVREYNLVDYEYKIQPEDVLSINFESLTPDEYNFFSSTGTQGSNIINQASAALTGELVDIEGNVEFPVVGKIKVAGLTVFQAQDHIQSKVKSYILDPVVKLRIVNFRFTVLGEVDRENTITSLNNRISMLEAIGLAGGFGELADRSAVKLIRQKGNKVEVQYLDFLNEDFMNSEYYYVHQNDMIVVPALKQRAFRKYFGPNLALIVSSVSFLLLVLNLSL